jgi:hypothetical protein
MYTYHLKQIPGFHNHQGGDLSSQIRDDVIAWLAENSGDYSAKTSILFADWYYPGTFLTVELEDDNEALMFKLTFSDYL